MLDIVAEAIHFGIMTLTFCTFNSECDYTVVYKEHWLISSNKFCSILKDSLLNILYCTYTNVSTITIYVFSAQCKSWTTFFFFAFYSAVNEYDRDLLIKHIRMCYKNCFLFSS